MDVNNILNRIKENALSEKTWNKTTVISYGKKDTPSIYIDMDGTLAYFYKDGRGCTYEQMFDPDLHYFWNLEPHTYMILLAKELSKTEDVCILSSAALSTIKDKYEWIKQWMPYIKDENIFFCPLGADKTKFVKDNADISMLIDDYNPNLKSWEKAGGIPVKAVNSINSPSLEFQNIRSYEKEKAIQPLGKRIYDIEICGRPFLDAFLEEDVTMIKDCLYKGIQWNRDDRQIDDDFRASYYAKESKEQEKKKVKDYER